MPRTTRMLQSLASLFGLSVLLAVAGCSGSGGGDSKALHSCLSNGDCAHDSNGSICDDSHRQCVVCKDDSTCGVGKHCDKDSNDCVECLENSHCGDGHKCDSRRCEAGCDGDKDCGHGKVCVSGACVGCRGKSDCSGATSVCDASTHQCVACDESADCAAGNLCRHNQCTPGCDDHSHCAGGKVCNPSTGACVECDEDADCKGGNAVCDIHMNTCVQCQPGHDTCKTGTYCAGNTCVAGCRGDGDCSQGHCIASTHACVACLTDGQCPQGEACGTDHACHAGCRAAGSCGAGADCCGGSCVALNTAANCGACGNSCGGGSGCCNAACTSLKTTTNCGACGNACSGSDSCCGSGCSNLLTDAANCGGCGHACGAGDICCSGQCKSPSAPSACADCSKACLADTIVGNGFGAGSNDGLSVDDGGLHTGDHNPKTQAIWIAMHNSNQVNKVDVHTGDLLGTFPSGGGNPSRGSMALDGTFWVAHRCPGDSNNPECSNVVHFNLDGSIACTVKHAADGAGLPFVRALAIDGYGNVWAGTWNDARIHKIDATTCTTVADYAIPGNPYGFAIDSKGLMWISTIGTGPVIAFDTETGKVAAKADPGVSTYGVAVDKHDNAFFAHWCGNGIVRIDGKTHQATYHKGGPDGYCARWVTTDLDANVWAAEWNGGTPSYAVKFSGGTGDYMATYQFPQLSGGLSIASDSYGHLWETGYNSNNVVRFSKDTGIADVVTNLGGQAPYNYSDFAGFALRTVTTNNGQIGSWDGKLDSGSPSRKWQSASWQGAVPQGGSLQVRFRAAASSGTLAAAPWCATVFTGSPVDLSTCNFPAGQQQWLEVSVRMTTKDFQTPVTLDHFSAFYQ